MTNTLGKTAHPCARGRRRGPCYALAILLAAGACRVEPGAGGGDQELRPPNAAAGRAADADLLREGAWVYREYCVGCHGENGDGKGPAARFLNPKPRDFTTAIFKFAGVVSGGLPRDEDLMRTLVHGLPGSSMPSWRLLPEESRRAVIAYVKTFSPAWSERGPAPPLEVSQDPFSPGDPASVAQAAARGRVVYHVQATCWRCHPAFATQAEVDAMAAADGELSPPLRPDATAPREVDDSWGGKLLATDFPRARLKSGSSLGDLYRTIAAGVGGTAMPTWKGGLPERDLWALTYYVKTLADERWRASHPIPSQPPAAAAR